MEMDQRTKKLLEDLIPAAKKIMHRMLEIAHANKLNMQCHSCYRSSEDQDKLYAMGRTEPGKIVTNARGGQSTHNYRIAADFHFLDKDGKIVWDEKLYKKVWSLVKAELVPQGLRWAGDWKTFKETAHFEYNPQDLKWRDLQKKNPYV